MNSHRVMFFLVSCLIQQSPGALAGQKLASPQDNSPAGLLAEQLSQGNFAEKNTGPILLPPPFPCARDPLCHPPRCTQALLLSAQSETRLACFWRVHRVTSKEVEHPPLSAGSSRRESQGKLAWPAMNVEHRSQQLLASSKDKTVSLLY
uniref:Uncharacterized protein n=1 Tax=Sphaerodactylus townsendi TaxID=933632 RepID=A0ACB8ECS7_9SAUR